ncbi:MAG TPA: o-succinylbenzoate synthase [Chloroflexota bacterium]
MRIRRVVWRGYRVPFRRPYQAAHGTLTHREGLLLSVELDDGTVGLGEVAPLAGFGGGRLGDCLVVLRAWASHFVGRCPDEARFQLARLAEHNTHVAALHCGLDTALLDAQTTSAGVALAERLGQVRRRQVPLNATVAAGSAAAAAAAGRAAVLEGFRCVKLKAGLERSVEAELNRIARVREAVGPGVELRLDANGAWSVGQAIELLRLARELGVALAEQPVAAHDLEGMARVRRAVDVPIGADEAVTGLAAAQAVLAAEAADVLIVKPTVVGGLRPAGRIVEAAGARGVGVIVTSTLETGVGLAGALQLAATLPEPPLACGLATGSLLASDLLETPLAARGGAMWLPIRPGLGVALDEAALERYGTYLRGEASA